MPAYEVDYEYNMPEMGVTIIEADNPEHAEILAEEYVREEFPDAEAINITAVKEINR